MLKIICRHISIHILHIFISWVGLDYPQRHACAHCAPTNSWLDSTLHQQKKSTNNIRVFPQLAVFSEQVSAHACWVKSVTFKEKRENQHRPYYNIYCDKSILTTLKRVIIVFKPNRFIHVVRQLHKQSMSD